MNYCYGDELNLYFYNKNWRSKICFKTPINSIFFISLRHLKCGYFESCVCKFEYRQLEVVRYSSVFSIHHVVWALFSYISLDTSLVIVEIFHYEKNPNDLLSFLHRYKWISGIDVRAHRVERLTPPETVAASTMHFVQILLTFDCEPTGCRGGEEKK